MIQLRLNKTGHYELTDRKELVVLEDQQVSAGERKFAETGEYEVNGVEVVFGTSAALIIWEQLHLVYIFKEDAPSAFEKVQFASCDIVIIDKTISTIKKDTFEEIMDAYDPRALVISNSTNIEATSKDSLQVQETSLIKLTEQTLPAEGRDFYKLV
jgi:hypothetical protein